MNTFHRPMAGRLYRQCLNLTRKNYSISAPSPAALSALASRNPKEITDHIDLMRTHLLNTTINDLLRAPQQSLPGELERLPQGYHLVYFPIQTPPSQLAPDGGDLDHCPGEPFVRRMWGGGEIKFNSVRGPLVTIDDAECEEVVKDVVVKGEGEGTKVFVNVVRRYRAIEHTGDTSAKPNPWEIEELRTLVFLSPRPNGDITPPSKLIKVAHKPAKRITVTPSPHHLFNFSALSYNAHRIHIDTDFARSEGHPAPLVHGPFTLVLMLRVLNDEIGEDLCVHNFSYRNFAPLYVNQEMSICTRRTKENEMEVWVEGPEGGLAVRGRATIRNKKG